MRTILKLTIPVEAGNQAIKSGRLNAVMESTLGKLRPEASYFYTEHGLRHALVVFDLKDPSDIPGIAEPLFMELNAAVDFSPVMNLEDLQKGLAKVQAAV